MIRFLRSKRRFISLLLVSTVVLQTVGVTHTYALTSGPTQPEVQSFQPAGTTEMVDLFTGDFSYNIPLFELPGPNGGYPFNLSYQAGITMDQEASWVGLGWSLQPGAITRQMRGLPDEFNGDIINTKMSIDPSVTVGLSMGADVEIFGAASAGLGFSVYQNSYKGFGYSIDGSVGFERTTKGMTGGLSLGFSLDSKEGVGVNPSLSLGGKIGEVGLGAGYNSKQGLTNMGMSLSVNAALHGKGQKGEDGKRKDKTVNTKFASSSSLSLAHPGFTPQVSMPMKNISLSATFKLGGSWWGISPEGYVTGFYSEQWLDKNLKNVPTKGYGYLNYQYATGTDLLDYNREKDGIVSKESPNLAIPSLTYDIYSVTGQGIGMMYRPMRNDYGIIHDQEISSVSNSVGVGVDVAIAASHVGVNLNVNHSKSTSGKWTENNNLNLRSAFQKKNSDDLYEPWYFKVHGEPTGEPEATLSDIGNEKAVRVKLTGQNANATASAFLENKQFPSLDVPDNANTNRGRKPRSQSISSITNGELLSSGNQEVLSHFRINYLTNTGNEVPFDRGALPKHHFAGYSALTADGLRYVYGIPAYNTKQEEVVFSAQKQAGQTRVTVGNNGQSDPDFKIANTDKFLKKTELPKYAHSFLLTSILGPDYVDVTNNGVTEDDLGYWVKFTYQKTTTDAAPYKWRDPFSKAHYQEGWRTDPRDDRGSFVYGEKEIWYLAKAETKSHIATFTIEARDDGRGVLNKLQDNSDKGASVYALKSIALYTRLAGSTSPIKVTRFEYNYSLCPGIENNINGGGKLTLKKLWFEYGGSQRGSLNPYNFTYNNEGAGSAIAYDINAYDRWGNYKPFPAGQPLYNQDFPYAEQDPAKIAAINANAAAWSLKEIVLPSGGKIIIDYESDDYGYVQQKTAMQMMAIVDPYAALPGGTLNNNFQLTQNNYKIRFKLEKSIAGTLTAAQQKEEVMKYLDTQNGQLYFKLLTNLRSQGEAFYEYISGYATIDMAGPMILEKQTAGGDYLYGSFQLVQEEGNNKAKHPFSMRAWQHLRTNQPELTNSGRKLEQTTDNNKRVNQIKSLGGIGAQIRSMFEGFYDYCDLKGWGEEVVADKSWIRLNSPDKIKYGGGLRVKQITMHDQWAQDDEGIYGQLFDYTMKEGTQTISSGVAAYEPIVGGDENALRYAKKYVQSVPLRSDNNLFFEYPVNESYYPGPQVGYRKVTVMTLPSAAAAGKALLNTTLPDGQPLFPTGAGVNYGTSGMTVHEFYTAKDFPVITDETEKANKQYKLSIPLVFFGSISITKLASSQGYSIITNDMHGRQKKISKYRQNKTGAFELDPISWVKYNYLSETKVVNKENVFSLVNGLKDNDDGTLSAPTASNTSLPTVYLGQETELFHDMRQFEDNALGGGARGNLDIVYIPLLFVVIPIPVPTVWPSIGKSTYQLRSSVTNKVIFRSGILESVEAFDGGSLVKTQNLKWDKLTGATVLTSVNNNFDTPVYSYSLPAFREYQGMGAAYQNIGLQFSISSVQKDPYKNELYNFNAALPAGTLRAGDEILLYPEESQFTSPIARVIYTGKVEQDDIIYTEQALTATKYKCMIVRSGYRNQLQVVASTITGLDDPSVKGSQIIYTRNVSVPR